MSRRQVQQHTGLAELIEVRESPIHGRGLFARCRISPKQYIGTFEGPPARRDGMYVLWVYDDPADETRAIGRIGRNALRFLNHAKPCNAAFDGFDLYARRTIREGDEITIDYGGEP